jgi:predicted MPP superfamily phosphohydrolase
MKKLLRGLGSRGVRVLDDDVLPGPAGTYIIGRRDLRDKERRPISDITKGLDAKRPLIILDHQPVELKQYAAAGADLTLSGHTHAGQVFPIGLISGLISTNEIDYGYRRNGNMQSIVTSGVGAWGFPMRVGTDSEIVVIDISFGK